jgi:hypothetical protein
MRAKHLKSWIWERPDRSSAATAQRDLADLVANGCLAPIGSGRGARYELVVESG